MQRKLIVVGGSAAVTIDPKWLRDHGLKLHDTVEVVTTDSAVVIRPRGPEKADQ